MSTISETSETEGSKESEEETDIEIATTSETKATKHKEKVFIEEYPSQSLFLDEDSPLPSTQVTIISALPPLTVGATEPLLPMAEGIIDTSLTMTQVILFVTSNFLVG